MKLGIIRNDCFAFTPKPRGKVQCAALNVEPCPDDCAFYKTMTQFVGDHDRAVIRVNSLPEQKAEAICDTYGIGPFLRHGAKK